MIETNNKIIEEIKQIIIENRHKVIYEVNKTMLNEYWNIGKIIVENKQNGNIKAEYGKQIIKKLSKELRKTLSSGFSISNFINIWRFYTIYSKFQTVSRK